MISNKRAVYRGPKEWFSTLLKDDLWLGWKEHLKTYSYEQAMEEFHNSVGLTKVLYDGLPNAYRRLYVDKSNTPYKVIRELWDYDEPSLCTLKIIAINLLTMDEIEKIWSEEDKL